MNDDDFLAECKVSNKRLMEFLCESDIMHQILDFITGPPLGVGGDLWMGEGWGVCSGLPWSVPSPLRVREPPTEPPSLSEQPAQPHRRAHHHPPP